MAKIKGKHKAAAARLAKKKKTQKKGKTGKWSASWPVALGQRPCPSAPFRLDGFILVNKRNQRRAAQIVCIFRLLKRSLHSSSNVQKM